MMIEINDQTTERLARQVAHETGESLTAAIRVSLEERLQRLTAKRNASMLASQSKTSRQAPCSVLIVR